MRMLMIEFITAPVPERPKIKVKIPWMTPTMIPSMK